MTDPSPRPEDEERYVEKLQTRDGAGRELARTVWEVKTKQIDPKVGNTLIYGLCMLIRAHDVHEEREIEREKVRKLEKLEREIRELTGLAGDWQRLPNGGAASA